MKKILLVTFLLSISFSATAYAETGKHLNWCKQDTKIKYPFYIHGKGKIKKHKSSKKLKDAQNKIVIIYNYGGGNAQKYHGICRVAAKNFAAFPVAIFPAQRTHFFNFFLIFLIMYRTF